MKSIVAALAAGVALGSAGPALAYSEFRGEMIVSGTSGTCRWDPTGHYMNVRYHPSEEDSTWAELSLFEGEGSRSYRLPDQGFDKTYRYVLSIQTFTGYGESRAPAHIAFLTQKPSKIAASTDFVTVTGGIKNFDGQDGCNLTFDMVLIRRPNN